MAKNNSAQKDWLMRQAGILRGAVVEAMQEEKQAQQGGASWSNGATGPIPTRPSQPADAAGMKILEALTGRILGNMTDEEKAEVLENIEQSNQELVEAVRSLDETMNAVGNMMHLWTRIMDEWSRSGGKSVSSFQSVVRDVMERAQR